MTTIDMGGSPVNLDGNLSWGSTYIQKENPANASGVIDTIEIYRYSEAWLRVGIFRKGVGDNDFTCIDYVTIIGGVPPDAGYNKFTTDIDGNPISLSVKEEDYLGVFWGSGSIERDLSGDGYWYLSGNQLETGEKTYNFQSSRKLAIYATGSTIAGENIYINIDDSYKQVAAAYVNVDDAWKEVTDIYVNVDDAWKAV